MADERIRDWAKTLETVELAAFSRARRRYLDRPSTKRLHMLRTAARRLRSLYDDFRGVLHLRSSKRLGKVIALTGEARDAAVLRKLLSSSLDAREMPAARSLMRELRRDERQGRKRVFRALLRLRLK